MLGFGNNCTSGISVVLCCSCCRRVAIPCAERDLRLILVEQVHMRAQREAGIGVADGRRKARLRYVREVNVARIAAARLTAWTKNGWKMLLLVVSPS